MKHIFRFLWLSCLIVLVVMPALEVEAQNTQPTHTVQAGDSLAAIAARYDTTVEILVALNNLDDTSYIYVGQVLQLPASASPAPQPTPAPTCGQTHVVRVGEGLFGIAALYNVSVTSIAQANGLADINVIHVGQSLCIPGIPAPAVPRTPSPTPAPSVPQPSPAGLTYEVKAGDTLFAIALAHGVSSDALITANGITNPSLLRPGQILRIPGGVVAPVPTPAPSPVVSAAPSSETITVQFFNDSSLTGTPALTREDPVGIPYDWGTGAPAAGINPDHFGVRLEGNFSFAEGNHRFTVTVDDGMRLYIDGNLVLDAWRDQPATTYETDVQMSAGTHHVRLDYYENTLNAYLWLRWEPMVPGTAPVQPAPVSAPATEPAPVPTPAGPAETFTVRFFNNLDMSGTPARTEVTEGPIKYDWFGQSPGSGVNRDNFSAIIEGHFTFTDGTHRFLVSADDGVRLFINGNRVLDEWRDQVATTYFRDIDLTAGRHHVRLEYYERSHDASVSLRWETLSSGGLGSLPGPEQTFLLSYDAEDRSTMLRAIEADDTATVTRLLVNRGYPDFRHEHLAAIHIAVQANALDVLAILLRHRDADPGERYTLASQEYWERNATALHLAASRNRPAAARLLLQHGADPDLTAGDAYTALHLAARFGRDEVAEILLDHGAEANPERHSNDYTPLHEVITTSQDEDVMEVLLDHRDTDVNAGDDNGITPLHLAVDRGEADLVELLLDHSDIDPNGLVDSGSAPLHWAIVMGQDNVMRMLLAHRDTDPNIQDRADGRTPLHWAVLYTNVSAAQLLLDHSDINKNVRDDDHRTPLEYAEFRGLGSHEIAELLR